MKCELCGTEVKVVGSVTKYYEPVNDTEALLDEAKEIIEIYNSGHDLLSHKYCDDRCINKRSNGWLKKIYEMRGE